MLTARSFAAMGTSTTVVVADEQRAEPAFDAARAVITEVDLVCSRFRDDSELCNLNRRAGEGFVPVSPLLFEAVSAALQVACLTMGLVDPTVGRALEAIGYTVTFSAVAPDGPALQLQVQPAPGWRALRLDMETQSISLPPGCALDLGASGKAWAADRAASAAADRVGAGVIVDCGGDIAIAGPAPAEGWPVRVAEQRDQGPWQDVHVFDGGLATSGTRARSWLRGDRLLHHIIDPRTGAPAKGPWRTVSVAAASCLQANAAATAALLLGRGATAWLEGLGLAARLVDGTGRVQPVGPWPAVVG